MITKILMGIIISFQCLATDVVITADEVSNTLSFVDGKTSKFLGYRNLGPMRNYALLSVPKRFLQTNVHSVAVSPDKRLIAVTSNVSNSVAIYDSKNLDRIYKYFNVGLSPHIGLFNPEGTELWVSPRGSENIEIIDLKTFKISYLKTEACPSYFNFHTTKKIVFVSNICTNKMDIFNYQTRAKVGSIELDGTFTPLSAFTPDQKELWLIRKDTNRVARINTDTFKVIESFEVGSFPQHIAFATNTKELIGLVTVGGTDSVNYYSIGADNKAKLVRKVSLPGVPHGVIVSPDSQKAFVATEHGDKVYTISLTTHQITNVTNIGSSPQAIVYIKDFQYNPKQLVSELGGSKLLEPTINFSLTVKNGAARTADVSVRSSPTTIFSTFSIYGGFKSDDTYTFYTTESKKKISDLKPNEKKIMGIVLCHKSKFACQNFTSLPQDNTTFESYKNKKTRIFAVNKDGSTILEN